MSIYASLLGIEQARAYAGSHILPSDTDPTTAEIGLALIPSHITRDGHDDQPEDSTPWPWLRVSICSEARTTDAVIDPNQARDLAQQLTEWADHATKETP